jgi:hypothetical protein
MQKLILILSPLIIYRTNVEYLIKAGPILNVKHELTWVLLAGRLVEEVVQN